MKKRRLQLRKNKRGFSLAETALALAIVLAVSLAAASLIMSSSNISVKGNVERRAYSHANSLVECFRFAETEEDMESAFMLIDPKHTRTVTVTNSRYFYEFDMKGYILVAAASYGITHSFTVTAYRGDVLTYGANNEITNSVICALDGFVKGVV